MNVEAWKNWEGRVVDGKFPLRQWVGGSDHSAVFLTERPGRPSEKAAIKLVAAPAADADHQLSRWRASAQLSNPHLISIYESGRTQFDGTAVLYVVMEFAEEDLSQILPQRALAPAEVAEMLPPLLDTVSYLHGKGLVHGHIKPSNVLAVGDLLKLSSDQIASPGEFGGPAHRRDIYDAPETAVGVLSQAGDLWSVGATLVIALTQGEPSGEESSRGDPVLPAGVPEPFRGIARECLRLDPKRRCSMAEIKARLQPAGRSVPVEPEIAPPPPRPVKRGPIVAGLLAVLLGVGFVIFHSRGKNAPSTPATVERPAAQSAPAPATPVHQTTQTAQTAAPAKKAVAVQGSVVRQVLPDAPASAMRTIRGTIKIVVRVEVDSSGKVTSAKFTSAGSSSYFAQRTLQAAQHWEFSPATVNGQPAPSTWLLRFRLKRGGTQVSAERVNR